MQIDPQGSLPPPLFFLLLHVLAHLYCVSPGNHISGLQTVYVNHFNSPILFPMSPYDQEVLVAEKDTKQYIIYWPMISLTLIICSNFQS